MKKNKDIRQKRRKTCSPIRKCDSRNLSPGTHDGFLCGTGQGVWKAEVLSFFSFWLFVWISDNFFPFKCFQNNAGPTI